MSSSSNKKNDLVRLAKQAGLFTSIPMVMMGGPAVGFFIGAFLDRRFSVSPWGVGAGVLLGLAAGMVEAIQLIRAAQKLENGPDNES